MFFKALFSFHSFYLLMGFLWEPVIQSGWGRNGTTDYTDFTDCILDNKVETGMTTEYTERTERVRVWATPWQTEDIVYKFLIDNIKAVAQNPIKQDRQD